MENSRYKILITEDESLVAQDIQNKLEQAGHEVVSIIAYGENVFEAVATHSPDLVLMDIRLKGEMSGIDAALQIKSQFDVPVVFLTAFSDSKTLEEVKETTSYGYIVKPFHRQELKATVELAVFKHQAEKKSKFLVAELQRSNKDLAEFAAICSHDLQEPLRKVILFGEKIEAKCADTLDEQSKDYFKRMNNATKRMGNFIDDLLKYSMVTAQAASFEPVDLNQAVASVLEDLETRISQIKGTVNVEALPTLVADPFQMRQLFLNLIGNALKFHKPDEAPVVTVSSSSDRMGNWKIVVRDNGIGFDEEYAEQIFRPFERLHGLNHFEGTGIGLSICEKIAARHGGGISAKSVPENGAVFTVTLAKNPILKIDLLELQAK